MSIRSIDYNGTPVPTGAPVTSPIQAAHAIMSGYIPENLVQLTNVSDAFRDATLSDLLTMSAQHDKFEQVLDTLCAAMQSAPDNSIHLRVYSEYIAAVAFAWEHQDLAARAIMRNTPQVTSPFLWTIVGAVKKNMPSAMYASFIISAGDQSTQKWNMEAAQLVGLVQTNQGVTI